MRRRNSTARRRLELVSHRIGHGLQFITTLVGISYTKTSKGNIAANIIQHSRIQERLVGHLEHCAG